MYTASNEVTRYTRHLILLLLYAEAGSTGYSQCVRTSYKYVYIQHHMQRLYGTWSSLPILALVTQTRAEVFVSNGHRGHCSHCFHMDNAITSAITWTLVSPLSHGHYSHVDTTITWTLHSRRHCSHTYNVITWTLQSRGHYYRMDTTIMWTLLSYGHYSYVDTTITWTRALLSHGQRHHIDTAITWTLVSPLSHGHYSHVDTTTVP